jgi:hypothetical protein
MTSKRKDTNDHEWYSYPLADLQTFPSSLFVDEDNPTPLEGFFLALAIVYNDLKGISIFARGIGAISKGTPEELSGKSGEQVGFRLQLTRLLYGTLHEFLVLVRENGAALNSEEFKNMIQSMSSRDRRSWNEIAEIAHNQNGRPDSPVAKFLLRVRNNAAFHYYQPKELLRGYNKHFHENAKTLGNEMAVVSIGKNMEESRYYFADAAVSGFLELMQGSTELPNAIDKLDPFVRKLNRVLSCLLNSFIQNRFEREGDVDTK